jgi:acetyl-CoA acetyltransferase
MNVARIAVALAGLPHSVGGVTVNRFCASGVTAIQMAADRIRVGEADVMIAGGAESMSMVPMGGNKPAFNPEIFTRDENVGIAYGMGLTAEKVAEQWKVSREDQDAFALASHQRAIKAQQAGEFADEICPVDIIQRVPDLATGEIRYSTRTVSLDEGPAPTPAWKAWASCAGVRRQGQRHRRQQLADQRRRRRADPGLGKGRQAVRPEAAGPLRELRLARRAAGNHGHRPDRGHPGRAEGRRPGSTTWAGSN